MMRPGLVRVLLWTVLLGRPWFAAGDVALNGKSGQQVTQGTIAFATVGRAHFGYDLFSLTVPDSWLKGSVRSGGALHEAKLTDGVSINYNGQFVDGAERLALLDILRNEDVHVANESSLLVFVSERGGSARVYFSTFFSESQKAGRSEIGVLNLEEGNEKRRQISETVISKNDIVILDALLPFDGPVFFDRPSVAGDNIVFVSTAEPIQRPRQSWAAVYSTSLKTRTTVRLTPKGVADFSPSVSPSGEWVVAASSERSGFQGEVEEVLTDLYVYRVKDGSNRLLVMKHGGWPCWGDDHTIFFHRQVADGWWSVFRLTLPENFLATGKGEVQEERITPPGVHAVTPAASPTGKWIAVATRRPGSQFRHVEIFDLTSLSFITLTENISPTSNHYSPFVSSYSGLLGYHRCRGNTGGESVVPLVEHVQSPLPDLALFRVDGTFPSFSPDGSLLAFVRSSTDNTVEVLDGDAGIYVSNVNGTGQRKVFNGQAFGLAWDRKRTGVLYASHGPIFETPKPVQVISVHNVNGGGELSWKQLTKSGNNAFPSPSPDGKYLVFRSARSGHKNLYIMDAMDGEEKEIRRLTEGPWTDQHPNWSPTGEWIAFVSNRENPKVGSFGSCSIYLIHPDGTGLHKVLQSSQAGLTVHPSFSPDGKKLVFVSDLAGHSGEPVSVPHQFQPYGEIFVADLDGSNIQRLTHNSLEDGTPAWSPSFLPSSELTREGQPSQCDFKDTRWLNSKSQVHSHFSCYYSQPLPTKISKKHLTKNVSALIVP